MPLKNEIRKEMELAEIRRAMALTQKTLAKTLDVGQAEISKIEHRADMFISTLDRFIRAIGGQLEIRAVFPDYSVKIKNFKSIKDNGEVK